MRNCGAFSFFAVFKSDRPVKNQRTDFRPFTTISSAPHKTLCSPTYDTMDWRISFLMGTDFSQKQWRPVIRGHAITGDIIAPIRKLSEALRPASQTDAAAVAEALVKIRSYFMPKRSKQKF